MESFVLALEDVARGRPLPTTLLLPAHGRHAPLILFAHGFWGAPRKFRRLFERWARAGYAVAAPSFPHTSDDNPPPYLMEDVVEQPRDLSFVLDELVAREIGDPQRIGVAGFSLGGETALALGLHPRLADDRVRAVAAVAGCLFHGELATTDLRSLPLLLVHGSADDTVAYAESVAVYEAAHEPKELVTLEGAPHDVCQDESPHAAHVAELLTAFFDRWLRG
ncbi:MAG TPA: alpha/beta fold hydrolase [Gaiellaceae bacterium]|nr:alpha/beta fold hydrolase [Gaiellaceae bacterium]